VLEFFTGYERTLDQVLKAITQRLQKYMEWASIKFIRLLQKNAKIIVRLSRTYEAVMLRFS
jgi:hypothetical protein